jgi:hypothetical protein
MDAVNAHRTPIASSALPRRLLPVRQQGGVMTNTYRAAAVHWLIACAFVIILVPSVTAQGLTPSASMLLPTRHSVPAELKAIRGRILAITRDATRFPGAGDHRVTLLDRSGNELFSRAPSQDLPDARVIVLQDATLTGNGTLVVSVEAQDAQAVWAAALIVYDIESKRTLRIVRTTPVICREVTADDGDNIWCLGPDVDKIKARQDYNVFWRYSHDGLLLGSAISRSQFPPVPFPWSMFPTLTTSQGTVTAWLPAYRTLVEFTAQGPRTIVAALFPSSIADEIEDFVALGSGRALILAATGGDGDQRQGIRRSAFTLDPGGAWRLMSSFPALPLGVSVIGSDDGQLVFWDRDYRRVLWVPETQLR